MKNLVKKIVLAAAITASMIGAAAPSMTANAKKLELIPMIGLYDEIEKRYGQNVKIDQIDVIGYNVNYDLFSNNRPLMRLDTVSLYNYGVHRSSENPGDKIGVDCRTPEGRKAYYAYYGIPENELYEDGRWGLFMSETEEIKTKSSIEVDYKDKDKYPVSWAWYDLERDCGIWISEKRFKLLKNVGFTYKELQAFQKRYVRVSVPRLSKWRGVVKGIPGGVPLMIHALPSYHKKDLPTEQDFRGESEKDLNNLDEYMPVTDKRFIKLVKEHEKSIGFKPSKK